MGFSSLRTSQTASVHLSLCFNPSHLAFITPVVQGRVRTRAVEDRAQPGWALSSTVTRLLGAGCHPESLNLSELEGYCSGGTAYCGQQSSRFHHQPVGHRSSYATDVAKLLQVPVFHVNGEHPDAVAQAIKLAMEFRSQWGRDVVIDMYCYRRYGHNEGDEPRYTQPEMYKRVDRQATVRENFVRNMVSLGVVSNADADAISAACKKALEDALERVRGGTGEEPKDTGSPIRSLWREFHGGLESEEKAFDTAISNDVVVDLLKRITTEPDIQLNRKLARLLKRRSEMLDGKPLDWWAGEALAFASLLREGTRIRLSGQDSQRGTFSHRHAVLHDQKTGQEVSAFDGVPGHRSSSVTLPSVGGCCTGFEFGSLNGLMASSFRGAIW